ncbi:Gfo/Idh/MocA family oxidoreductase [bacterium]|nr:Gfo/Idh/MocA family oxidoreductase [bacterium]
MRRRLFLGTGAGGLAGAVLSRPFSASARVIGANDRINIGVIGCGGRSGDLMRTMAGFMKQENFTFTALCDVWKPGLEKRAAWVREVTGSSPKTFSRYNDLLALKDVDAVMITTPDHGHSPVLIAASNAGKDVFCEKPMAMTMEEARGAVDTVRRNKTICQIGTQHRSEGKYITAAKYIQEGKIGKVITVDLKYNDNGPRWERNFSDVKEEDVDWEGYLMHTKKYPFHPRRYRCWHLYRDYSIGLIGLLGAHCTDLVTWFMKAPYPESAVAFGDRLVWKDREHYDTIIALYKYKDFIVTCEHRLGNKSMRSQALFYGTQGMITPEFISSEGHVDPKRLEPAAGAIYTTSPLIQSETDNKPVETPLEPDPTEVDHNLNWIRAMRDRKDPNATVEDGFSHSVIAIMGHMAADKRKAVAYDPSKREIVEI